MTGEGGLTKIGAVAAVVVKQGRKWKGLNVKMIPWTWGQRERKTRTASAIME